MLNDDPILSIEACQILAGVAAISEGFFPESHKLATRAVFMKKGNLARGQIPFEYCEGGI
jgi:hypothetical protein